jgi:hypothetical protein
LPTVTHGKACTTNFLMAKPPFAESFLPRTRQSFAECLTRPSAKKVTRQEENGDGGFAECQDGKALDKVFYFFEKEIL